MKIDKLIAEGTELLERSLQSLQNKEKRRSIELLHFSPRFSDRQTTKGQEKHWEDPEKPQGKDDLAAKPKDSVLAALKKKRAAAKPHRQKSDLHTFAPGDRMNYRALKLAKRTGAPEPKEVKHAKLQKKWSTEG